MTVSNPASLSSANAEFGGNGSLSALVRGGSYVASNASSTISTTVVGLALSQFNGVTKPASATFSMPSNLTKVGTIGKPTTSTITMQSNCTYTSTAGQSGTWASPTQSYDVYVTAANFQNPTSNGSVQGTLNTWVTVNGQSWGVSIGLSGGGFGASVDLTFQFRITGQTAVLGSKTVYFEADN